MNLLKAQKQIAKDNFDKRIFLTGIAGTGKTTAAIERVKQLIREGADADAILVIVPQSVLAVPYREALQRARVENGGDIHTTTLGKLAFEMVDLFWPLIADEVGFAHPTDPPHFLSLELVQYYMTRFVEPEIDRRDYFNSVHISRNRLYTQIVDNLNKSALVGFTPDSIGYRLKSAWRGELEQQYIYDDAQAAAQLFREVCRDYNMLDFSLQVTLFVDFLWPKQQVQDYLTQQYKHLIVDNIEEDTPATHDILRDWLPKCESAVVIYDEQGGYRRFLGADPDEAQTLQDVCEMTVRLDNHRTMSGDLEALQVELSESIGQPITYKVPKKADARQAIIYTDNRYHPQMIDWAAQNVAALIHNEGVQPNEIVILAPYMPDALRFALQTRLDELDVPNRAHRPSRALRDEPAARTLLTLAKIAHPQWAANDLDTWQVRASKFDVAYALTTCIDDLDLVRARLLVDVLYRGGALKPFEQIQNETMQERITFELGMRYDVLRAWLDAYRADTPLDLDIFFSKLFGDVLSQPQFGFHAAYDAATTAANLIDSAREFRQTVSKIEPDLDTASEYVRMVDKGVIANQYVRDWQLDAQESVLIAPAYTFLLSNAPVDYQIWLNVGSSGWAQRINQPLTHPYVLSRQWHEGQQWTDEHEVAADLETLCNLTLGLIRRCRKQIYLGFSDYSEQGQEQRGPLLMAIQGMLRRLRRQDEPTETPES